MTLSVSSATPILRWAGSKRALIPKLIRYVPKRVSLYIEPFAGSACLFLKAKPAKAVVSDANLDLIQTYITVRTDPRSVFDALHAMPVSKENYYVIRSHCAENLTATEQAARFIYLNRFCFNGLYRTNTHGKFNVPFGAPKNSNVPTLEELIRFSEALKAAKLVCDDFEAVVKKSARAGSFVYLDPPFYRSSERTFREYNARPFGQTDLIRLCKLLDWLDARSIPFLVSYASCPEAEEAFSKWSSTIVSTARNISGFAVHRRRSEELLISNSPFSQI